MSDTKQLSFHNSLASSRVFESFIRKQNSKDYMIQNTSILKVLIRIMYALSRICISTNFSHNAEYFLPHSTSQFKDNYKTPYSPHYSHKINNNFFNAFDFNIIIPKKDFSHLSRAKHSLFAFKRSRFYSYYFKYISE